MGEIAYKCYEYCLSGDNYSLTYMTLLSKITPFLIDSEVKKWILSVTLWCAVVALNNSGSRSFYRGLPRPR